MIHLPHALIGMYFHVFLLVPYDLFLYFFLQSLTDYSYPAICSYTVYNTVSSLKYLRLQGCDTNNKKIGSVLSD